MMSKVIIGVFAACLLLEAGVFAHHSVTVNFDASRAMDLTGRLTEVDIRNPHSRITLEVKQPDGTVKEWLIEWSDRNALVRRKVPFQLLHVGDTVTINVSPSRMLDKLAYFRTAVLPDSSILRDCGFGAFREAIANGETVDCQPAKGSAP